MGRARLTLKHKQDERIRRSTFIQRGDVLMKKVSKFYASKNKGKGKVCLIVYDANDDAEPVMTWPKDLPEVHSILEKYEHEKNEKPPKIFGIRDYFDNKKDVVEAQISKVRKDILEIKYPTWDPRFNTLGDEQLLNFIAILDAKGKACSRRINALARTKSVASTSTSVQKHSISKDDVPESRSAVLNPVPNLAQSDAAATDSTNQLGDPDWDSLIELVQCDSQFDMPEYWSGGQLHQLRMKL